MPAPPGGRDALVTVRRRRARRLFGWITGASLLASVGSASAGVGAGRNRVGRERVLKVAEFDHGRAAGLDALDHAGPDLGGQPGLEGRGQIFEGVEALEDGGDHDGH